MSLGGVPSPVAARRKTSGSGIRADPEGFERMLSSAKIHRVGHALSELAVRWRHKLGEWRRRDRERMELRRMSDRELRDFGVTRADIWEESHKPFWRR